MNEWYSFTGQVRTDPQENNLTSCKTDYYKLSVKMLVRMGLISAIKCPLISEV